MSNVTYTITRCEAETGNTSDKLTFNQYDHYVTDGYDDEKKVMSNYSTSLNDISGMMSEVPAEDAAVWAEACREYVRKYNKELREADVKFDLLNKLDDTQFEYNKYVNGSLVVDHGVGCYLDLKGKKEKDAWLEDVKRYNSENGIEGPITKMKLKVEAVKAALAGQDTQFPDEMSLMPPMVETVLAEMSSGFGDPCEFIEKLSQAIAIAIPKSYPGILKETFNYEKNAVKFNAKLKVQKALNATKSALAAVTTPVTDKIIEALDNYEELEAAFDAVPRRFSESVAEYDAWVQEMLDSKQLSSQTDFSNPIYSVSDTVPTTDSVSVKPLKAPSDKYVDYDEYIKIIKSCGFDEWLPSPIETFVRMSSGYGMRQLKTETKPRLHGGVDLSCVTGTKLYAIAEGTVVRAVYAEDGNAGGLRVIIQHKKGTLYTMYCHMSEVNVRVGDKVVAGTYIGKSGNTGYKGGPHLHFATGTNPSPPWSINAEEFLYTLARNS